MSDDNKVKLLKIQHALLEALAEKKIHAETDEIRNRITNELNLSLLKYKELVTEIEHGIYLELKDKINRLSDSELTLEEELNQLEEIETFYNQLVEIQTRFKQTYALYSKDDLILSDINSLGFELYLQRKEAIKAYLINKKNITDSKIQIEKINDELISEEQKENRIDKKITFLDDEIIRRLLSSEGRLLVSENNQETLKYTSISSEYQNIGITLDKEGFYGTTIEELIALANETKEKITAATISYEVLPNIENKKILDEISLENITANYHLVLGKLLNEFYMPSKNCDGAIQKRERIKDLLKYRQTYLNNLGIKYGVDPFTRLHINEQIEELRQYENNSRIIAKLRRELATLNALIETLEANNIENSTKLEESQNAIKNRQNIVVQPEPLAPSFNDFTADIKPAEVRTLDNQVVSVTDTNPNFNYKKCQEVTQNVIKKVYEIITHPEISMPTESAPELVIEPSAMSEEITESEQPAPYLTELSEDIFSKIEPFNEAPISEEVNQLPEIIVPEEWTSEIPEEIFLESELPVVEQVGELNKEQFTEEVLTDTSEPIVSEEWTPELTIEPKITIQPAPITIEEIPLIVTPNTIDSTPMMPSLDVTQPLSEKPVTVFTPIGDNNQLFSEPVQTTETISPKKQIMTPEVSMPDLFESNKEEQQPADIFSDVVPFESPTMFTEKVDSVEPEKIFPPIEIPAETPSTNITDLDEMKIKLEENRIADNIVDFWSTDADINNITNQPSELNEEIKSHRKGM